MLAAELRARIPWCYMAAPLPAYWMFDRYTPHCAAAQGYREAITGKVRYRCRHAVTLTWAPA